MKSFHFRKAVDQDSDAIWNILQGAVERRRLDGSSQWQDGYPNPETVTSDIRQGIGFVLTDGDEIAAYAAVIFNDEPAYEDIEGNWFYEGDFNVVHRVAVSEKYLGRGLATEMFRKIETYSLQNGINSIKVDTNFDNPAMLRILEKLGYQYCGKVYFRGSARMAYQKTF